MNHIFRLTAVTTTVLTIVAGGAAAQSAPSPTPAVTMWGPNLAGPMARVGNTLYVGGGFDYVGPPTGSFAIVDAADATQINTTARVVSTSSSVVADGAGGWFVAPIVDPISVGQGALTLKHILSSGAVDPAWTMPALGGGSIAQTFVDGPRLYIAGSFTAVGGAARQGLAALDVATGALLPFTTTRSVATVFPNVFVDGGFVYLSGLSTGGGPTAVLDGVTGADVPFAATSTWVTAASGARIYGFSQNPSGRLDAFDRAGLPLPGWVSPTFVGEIVHQVVASASRVYVVSYSNNRARITAYDALTGASQPAWAPPPFTVEAATNSLDIWTIALDGGTLYVGGTFSAVNGQVRSRVAALDATTGALTPWAPLIGGRVTSLAVSQGRVAVAGSFSSAGGISRKYLAALDLTTGLPLDVVPPVANPITALIASGDLVLAAEGTTSAGEVFGFSAASGMKYPVVLPFSGTITALEMAGTRIFMGGLFAFGTAPARNLAAFDLAAGLLPWNPPLAPNFNPVNPNQPLPPLVTVLRARLGRLYAGGFFTAADASSRGGGAAFDLNSLALTAWNPQSTSVTAVEVWQNRMLISAEGSVARWVDPESGDALSIPAITPALPTQAIALAADTFILLPGAPAALDARTGQLLPWNVTISGRTLFALGSDDLVIVGGDITAVGQQPAANLAVFRTSPPAPPRNLTFDNGAGAVTLAWTAAPGAAPTSYVIEAGTAPGLGDLGRFPVGSLTQVTAGVGAGTYALRVFAVGPTGTSAASSDIVFTRPPPAAVPSAPSELVGSATAGVLSLSWSPSADATTYIIEGGTAAGLTNLGVLPTGVLDTNIAGTVPAGTYYLRLRAANRFGVSGASNEVRVVVP